MLRIVFSNRYKTIQNSQTLPKRHARDLLKDTFTHASIGNHGFIQLVDVMPRLVPENKTGDSRIVDAARVSYGPGTKKNSEDRKLIRYLWQHSHTSPFEMAEVTFSIRAPIFVLRQWIRHRTANVNEESARYTPQKLEMFTPQKVRIQSNSSKQSSFGETSEKITKEFRDYTNVYKCFHKVYTHLLESGVAREQARIGLPQAMYSTMYWKCDLNNLLRFLRLRMHPTAQEEIRDYATIMKDMITPMFPYTLEAFEDFTLESMTLSKQEIESISNRKQNENFSKRQKRELIQKCEQLGIEKF